MAAKGIAFLVLFMAAFLLIASEVAARELAENTDATKPTEETTDIETDQYGYGGPGGYGGYGGRGGYGGYGGRGGYGGYGGRGGYGGYGGRGGYGGYGGRGGYGGYGGRGGYGGYGGRGCYYGRCGYRCCYFAGENTDANVQSEPQN